MTSSRPYQSNTPIAQPECLRHEIAQQLCRRFDMLKLPNFFLDAAITILLDMAGGDYEKVTPELVTDMWRGAMGGLDYQGACRMVRWVGSEAETRGGCIRLSVIN